MTVWAGPDLAGVVYAYAPGRGAIHGLRLLKGYRGIIHCNGYEAVRTRCPARSPSDGRTRRRRFVKIEREAVPAPAPVAREVLERVALLYAIEKALPGQCVADRCVLVFGRSWVRRCLSSSRAKERSTRLSYWGIELGPDHLRRLCVA